MPTTRPTICLLLAVATTVALAAPLTGDDGDANAPTTRPCPTTLPSVDPAVSEILSQMEKAADYRNIRSDLTYQVYDRLEGSTETRTGWVIHQPADGNAPGQFAVHFETLQRDKKPKVRERIDYAFNGQWLTIAKEKVKQVHRVQVAGKGEQIEPMRLGRGPFPMPFGQSVPDMVRFFEISTRDASSSDPNGTVYLELVTRPAKRAHVNFLKLEMWLDTKTHRPVKIISHQGDPTRKVTRDRILRRDIVKRTTVTFEDTKTNVELPEDVFKPAAQRGWKVIIEPLKSARERNSGA